MSTNQSLYGTNLHSNGFLVTQVLNGMDIPIYDAANPFTFGEFILYDVDGVTPVGGMTINEHRATYPNRKAMYSTDGLIYYYGMMIPFTKDGQDSLNKILGGNGLAVSKDFTTINDKDYWVCNTEELLEWLDVSPHMVAV